MTPAVAIFVKTPGHSPIKTRLADRLGRTLAEACHLRSAACVAERVAASGLCGHWAVAEAAALSDPAWASLPRLHQGDGSLGRRMACVHAELVRRHGAALLVGADLPQIEAGLLRRAADWLDAAKPRLVLGRARDGGFWLFGSNRAHPLERWESVSYSAADTADRFVENIGDGRWLELPSRTDLDRPGDLDRVVDELRALESPSDAQQALIPWLERCIERVA
jgi:glycosyltransferase A (GT-A) superfamily protein (DUF2064 family)